MIIVQFGQVNLEGGLCELLTQLFQLLLQLYLKHAQTELELLDVEPLLFNLLCCSGGHLNLYTLSRGCRRFRAS